MIAVTRMHLGSVFDDAGNVEDVYKIITDRQGPR